MIVKVLYFAAAQDLVSRKSEEIEMARGASVHHLAAEILRIHPPLNTLMGSIRFSVNLEVSAEDAKLRDGDEVGVLPPVAGG